MTVTRTFDENEIKNMALTFQSNEDSIFDAPLTMDEKTKKILDCFTTHSDGRVIYGLRNLPPEFVALLLARYSRSSKPLNQILYDIINDMGESFPLQALSKSNQKLISSEVVKKFHQKYTIDFGHDSIRKMADGLAIAIDRISILAAHRLRDNRIGASFIERSTRYQNNFFDNKDNYLDSSILFPPPDKEQYKDLHEMYNSFCRTAIGAAKITYEYMINKLQEIHPYEELKDQVEEKEYNKWIKDRAMDTARYLLPVASITGIGMTMNAKAADRILSKLYNHPSPEDHIIAVMMHDAVTTLAPNLTKELYVNPLDAVMGILDDPDIEQLKENIIESVATFDRDRLNRPNTVSDSCYLEIDEPHMKVEDVIRYLASVIIARQLVLPTEVVYNWFRNIVSNGKLPQRFLVFKELPNNPAISDIDFALKIIYKYTGQYTTSGSIVDSRATRVKEVVQPDGEVMMEVVGWEKLPRIFELVNLTFSLIVDFGAWRDLATHSMATKINYPLTPSLGCQYPDDYNLFTDELKRLYGIVFNMSGALWDMIVNKYQLGTAIGEYAGLNMWNCKKLIRVNLRELDYIIGLRTRWPGHHSYRRAAMTLLWRMSELWPTLAKLFRGDLNNYALGRIKAKDKEPKGFKQDDIQIANTVEIANKDSNN